jgi:hypothetical protein
MRGRPSTDGERRFNSSFDLRALGNFFLALRNFLRRPITVEEARKEVERRIALRDERFLNVVERNVFRRPESPYWKLFKNAGCDYGDLAGNLKRYGVEKTLEQIAAEGVYLTPEEFKGKREISRGSKKFYFNSQSPERDRTSPSIRMQSSGTSNAPQSYFLPVKALASRSVSMCVFLEAHQLFAYSFAVHDAILPSNGGARDLLVSAGFGHRIERWFAGKVPSHRWLSRRWSEVMTHLIVFMGNVFGPGFPRPEFVDVENVQPILDWISQERRRGRMCFIGCTASNATRIARAAYDKGISLEGTKFRVGGEPFTEAKREVIARSGAVAIPVYGFEGGVIGFGCANPSFLDDLHVDVSQFALIARPQPLEYAAELHPLLLTTLDEDAQRFYLNVDIGDHAILSRRRCSCLFERLGMAQHIHQIRSHEKFTSEGMNYFYGDLFELLENSLPSEFGGGPGDYQLVEEEDAGGQTRLVLIVHPQVGFVREEAVLSRLHDALARGSRANDFQTGVWKNAGTVKIKRQLPLVSARGKILPLRFSRA